MESSPQHFCYKYKNKKTLDTAQTKKKKKKKKKKERSLQRQAALLVLSHFSFIIVFNI